MQARLATLPHVSFREAAWLLPFAYTFHLAEEWNIAPWFEAHFIDAPRGGSMVVRVALAALAVAGFFWTFLATMPRSTTLTVFLVLPFAAILGANGLQHLFWSFYFGGYAPGVVTSVAFLIPISVGLHTMAVRKQLVPRWYVVVLDFLVVLFLVATMRAGPNLDPVVRALLEWGARGSL